MVGLRSSTRCRQNFVAEIKLRNINREYILKRTAETDALEKDIADLEATLESKRRIRGIIIRELKEIIRKYPSPRRTGIVAAESVTMLPTEDLVPDYPVQLFLSREGYFKKITPQSLRMSGEQKYQGRRRAQPELRRDEPRGTSHLHRPSTGI